jgi:hypothetical protein
MAIAQAAARRCTCPHGGSSPSSPRTGPVNGSLMIEDNPMSKSIIIAAAASALFFTAAPAFAQDASRATPGFNGPHGSATNLRDTPSSDPTAAHVKVFDGKTGADLGAAPTRNPSTAHHPAFNGPHGAASDLSDRPSSDPTAATAKPRPSSGVTKVGTGTLALGGGGTATPRHPAFNGPHGSASDLTDRPASDPTAATQIKRATLYGRKSGDDKRQDY